MVVSDLYRQVADRFGSWWAMYFRNPPPAGDEPAPGERLEASELGERISGAVAGLPDEQKEVFVMRVRGELPFKEIARIQGVSINTALARMQYAITKLRPVLARDYADLCGKSTGRGEP